jgi:hypothetical protein
VGDGGRGSIHGLSSRITMAGSARARGNTAPARYEYGRGAYYAKFIVNNRADPSQELGESGCPVSCEDNQRNLHATAPGKNRFTLVRRDAAGCVAQARHRYLRLDRVTDTALDSRQEIAPTELTQSGQGFFETGPRVPTLDAHPPTSLSVTSAPLEGPGVRRHSRNEQVEARSNALFTSPAVGAIARAGGTYVHAVERGRLPSKQSGELDALMRDAKVLAGVLGIEFANPIPAAQGAWPDGSMR